MSNELKFLLKELEVKFCYYADQWNFKFWFRNSLFLDIFSAI